LLPMSYIFAACSLWNKKSHASSSKAAQFLAYDRVSFSNKIWRRSFSVLRVKIGLK
jgi:hypothetical protein